MTLHLQILFVCFAFMLSVNCSGSPSEPPEPETLECTMKFPTPEDYRAAKPKMETLKESKILESAQFTYTREEDVMWVSMTGIPQNEARSKLKQMNKNLKSISEETNAALDCHHSPGPPKVF